MGVVPVVDLDLYGDRTVEDSTAAFKQIRDAAPVVRLPRNRLWAIGRFDDVRAALRDDELFASDHGVAANALINFTGRKSILFSNGETHATRRRVQMRPLGAKALAPIADRLDREADAVVRSLVGSGEFDAVPRLSSALPVQVIADLIGLRVSSDRLLDWAAKAFDQLGPFNRRWWRSGSGGLGMLFHMLRLRRSRLVSGAGRRGFSTRPTEASSGSSKRG